MLARSALWETWETGTIKHRLQKLTYTSPLPMLLPVTNAKLDKTLTDSSSRPARCLPADAGSETVEGMPGSATRLQAAATARRLPGSQKTAVLTTGNCGH